jgi:hypothetical protein
MATGQVGFKDQKKVKRVYVAKRENPIVNRLNKTKVEKFPDFRQEKEDRARELRKKDRSVIAERVRQFDFRSKREIHTHTTINRQRKKLASQERGKNWHTRGITHTTTGTRRSRSWPPATRIAIRTGRTISCEKTQIYKVNPGQNTKAVSQSQDHLRALSTRFGHLCLAETQECHLYDSSRSLVPEGVLKACAKQLKEILRELSADFGKLAGRSDTSRAHLSRIYTGIHLPLYSVAHRFLLEVPGPKIQIWYILRSDKHPSNPSCRLYLPRTGSHDCPKCFPCFPKAFPKVIPIAFEGNSKTSLLTTPGRSCRNRCLRGTGRWFLLVGSPRNPSPLARTSLQSANASRGADSFNLVVCGSRACIVIAPHTRR